MLRYSQTMFVRSPICALNHCTSIAIKYNTNLAALYPQFNRHLKSYKVHQEEPYWRPFEKNFYKPPDIIHPKEDIDRFISKHKITVNGPAPSPILSFDEYCFPDYLQNELKGKDFATPTPIQSQCWPIALSGLNLVGVAQTGSGKTLGYILPAIVHVKNQEKLQKREGPIALVLAPTRELAQQIQQVVNEFGTPSNVRNACVFGGSDKRPQVHALQQGSEIVIATPGRLIDFLDSGMTNLNRCTYLVLDEADLLGKHYARITAKYTHLPALNPRFSTFRNFGDNEPGHNSQRNFGSPQSKRNRDFRNKRHEEKPAWKPFEKNFYKPPDIVHPKEDIDSFIRKHKITINGSAPAPILSFDEVCFPDYIQNKLTGKDFTTPTPIQSQCWPIALSGQNLVGVAQTGSGKTLGYILPAIVHIKNQEELKQKEGPIALVLAPTRELAQQIQQVANEFGEPCNVRNACVFGGANKGPQIHALHQGR
ncbi:hypothetical protein HA402_008426 [Bradysia odoriphaga]|nr:hypothetical protein HA402_008426 [Bradysia odoriphaga]